MRLLADESVDFGIIESLREKSVDVISISEQSSGINDTEVLSISNLHKCLLITEDKDFGELAYRLKLEHHGILLIRLSELPRNERVALASDIIIKHFNSLLGSFSVLTKQGLRIKTKPPTDNP